MTTQNEPKFFRAGTSHGLETVERDGGAFGHGVIRGVSVITRGEALGHELWVDSEFLTDVTTAINSSDSGVKARFTHPGLSNDGVGSKLGRLQSAKTVGDQVFADLHFQEAATKTPDGNLADYVLTLAEETPEDFGLSIVFEHDVDAMNEHTERNSVYVTGKNIFTSPDEANKDNFEHARLSNLRAADVVDSPAANPDGLFKRGQETAQQADSLLSYALGLTDAKPDTSAFNVDGDRVQQFLTRFLSRHNLSIQKGGDPVPDDITPVADTPLNREDVAKQFRDELNRYVSAFGTENGTEWFSDGVSFEDAQGKHIEALGAQLALAQAKIEELEESLHVLTDGEDDGGDFSTETTPRTLASKIRFAGASNN